MSITLEDVEIAIKILTRYLRLSRQAEGLLRQLGKGKIINPNELLQQILQQTITQQIQKPTINEEEEISEQELQKLREIGEEYKKKYFTKKQPSL